jgi:hypothetical protein
MSDTMWVKKSRVSASIRHRVAYPSHKEHVCYGAATVMRTEAARTSSRKEHVCYGATTELYATTLFTVAQTVYPLRQRSIRSPIR